MKKLVTLLLVLAMALSLCGVAFADDVTLDVIIAQYGPNTNNWFLGREKTWKFLREREIVHYQRMGDFQIIATEIIEEKKFSYLCCYSNTLK